jgi:hypothetical protein
MQKFIINYALFPPKKLKNTPRKIGRVNASKQQPGILPCSCIRLD